MFNKINYQGQVPKNRIAFSRNLHVKSKLTVFMVYKMLEKRAENESQIKCSSLIYEPEKPKHYSQLSNKDNNTGTRINKTRTDLSYSRFECFRDIRQRNRCETEIYTDEERIKNKNETSLKKTKTIENNQSLQFNKLIIDRIKKVTQLNQSNQQKRQIFEKSLDFGLNIKQVKSTNIPVKKTKKRQRISFKISEMDKLNEPIEKSITMENQIIVKQIPLKKQPSLKQKVTFSSNKIIKLQQCLEIKQPNKIKQFIAACKDKKIEESKLNKICKQKIVNKQINLFHLKMKKMNECLDIILNSFHCSIVRKLKTQCKSSISMNIQGQANKHYKKSANQKYYYYIGGGNNCNLIRSILRKRNWWVQVDNINKANFIWTQLKIPQMISKSTVFDDSNWLTDSLQNEQASLLRTTGKKSNSTANSQNVRFKQIVMSQLFHQKQDKRYYDVLDSKQTISRLQRIETPTIIHNHYQHNYMFGNKNALYYNLSQYYEFTGKDLSTIVPLTFYLEKGNNKSIIEFQKIFNDPKRKNTIWIVKPAQNSNRGQGIQVTASFNQIKATLNYEKKIIVQSYIRNLLLYNGRKFDIRSYMIALTVHGRLKFYWYEEGYIRTSSEYYDLSNLNDSFIHLTNDAIQKNGQNYGKYEDGNKLSFSQFQRYLETRFQKENIHVCNLNEQMKNLAKQAVKAIYCRIDPNRKQYSFQLFGLDFIIDSQFKPFLIEINTNPCLELSSPCLQRLIPRMMENLFRLCVDPIFRPQVDYSYSKSEAYYIYDKTFLERNKFSLIFDEKYDRNFQWQERCRQMSGLQWGEGQQQEYDEQGSLIVVDY